MSLQRWGESVVPWVQSLTHSHRVQLLIASGTAIAVVILAVQGSNRDKSIYGSETLATAATHDNDSNQLDGREFPTHVTSSSPSKHAALVADKARLGFYDEDLILEQLSRNRSFLSDEGLRKLRSSFVIIVGCGGVGSHAAATLARSGVSRLRFIDFDQVTLSSLNRHALAILADVGIAKVHCLQRRLEQITPWVEFDCRNELFRSSSAPAQLASWGDQPPTFVIDAIDNIDSKVELLQYCHVNSIPVVSSMGAGTKSDPTQVFLADISMSTDDPLSKATRRRLRMLGIDSGIPVVFSKEKPGPGKARLLPISEDEFEKGSVGDLGVLPDFRVRILPVLGTMPAIFGLTAANHVILEVSGYPYDYISAKGRSKMHDAILGHLQGAEERRARETGDNVLGLRLPISQEDVGYLVDEVFRGKSVISGLTGRLTLVRWRPSRNLVDRSIPGQIKSTLKKDELVCVTKEEAAKHEKEVLKVGVAPESVYEEDVVRLVNRRIEEQRMFERYK